MASYEIESMVAEMHPFLQRIPVLHRKRVRLAFARFTEYFGTEHLGRVDSLPDTAVSLVFQLVSIFRFLLSVLSEEGTQELAADTGTADPLPSQRILVLLEDAADCVQRIVVKFSPPPTSSPLNRAHSAWQDTDVLRVLNTAMNCEANARFWVRWFGAEQFSVERWVFVEAAVKELGHVSVSTDTKKELVMEYVTNEMDFNSDGTIDLMEFALCCGCSDVARVLEDKCRHALVRASPPKQRCSSCEKLETELLLERRTVQSLRKELDRLKNRQGLLGELRAAQDTIVELRNEIEALRGTKKKAGLSEFEPELSPQPNRAKSESVRMKNALAMLSQQRSQLYRL